MSTAGTSPYSMMSTSSKKKQARGGSNIKRATATTTTTIQVKVGNHIARPMTPTEAAEYLKTLTASNASNFLTENDDAELQMIVDHHHHHQNDDDTNTMASSTTTIINKNTIAAMMENYSRMTGGNMTLPLPTNESWLGGKQSTTSPAGTTKQNTRMKPTPPLPSSSVTTALATVITDEQMMSATATTLPYTSLPMAAQAAFAANGMFPPNASSSSSNPMSGSGAAYGNNHTNLPCSEKEMKALMSMFVEIMSLQMNTDRLNQTYHNNNNNTSTNSNHHTNTGTATNKGTGPPRSGKRSANGAASSGSSSSNAAFQFPTNVPPPPQGWPECLAWPPIYELRGNHNNNNNNTNHHENDGDDQEEEDDDSMDSLPALENIPVEDRPKMIQYAKESRTKAALLAAVATAATVRHGSSTGSASMNDSSGMYYSNTATAPVTTYIPMPPVPGSTTPMLDVTGPVTGSMGIEPLEWSMIERAVIEDALEQEELLSMRIRKHNNNNNVDGGSISNSTKKTKDSKKKKSPPQMFPSPNLPQELASRTAASITSQEATLALQKVEEANRKLSKAVTMWRNRVATAVTQNEISKLELLLHESPLRTVTHMQQQAASVLSFHNNMNHTNGNVSASINNAMLGQGMSGVDTVDDHLRYLVPMTVPKNFVSMKSHNSNSVARKLLAQYIISEFSPNHFVIPGQNGRSVLHMACMMADLSILKLILDHAKQTLHPNIVGEVLLKRCHDSGWNAFHYAISSGSLRVIEAILQSLSGEDELIQKVITSLTNDTLTWKRGETVGISPQFLACALLSYHPETRIETHGMALQEIVNHRIRNKTVGSQNTIDPSWYVAYLTQIAICLTLIQANGHVALDEAEIIRIERDTIKQLEENQVLERKNAAMAAASSSSQNSNDPTSSAWEDDKWMDSDEETSPTTTVEKKKTKKKKKKNKPSQNSIGNGATQASVSVSSKDTGGNNKNKAPYIDPSDRDVTSVEESEVSKPSVTVNTELSNDPLVTALLGMGFEQNAIMDGIKACGGTSRATADDVVAWIFGGGSDTNETTVRADIDEKLPTLEKPKAAVPPKVTQSTSSYKGIDKHAEELRRKEQEERIVAEKLAAKREEQRRRNREWNNRAQARQIQETQEKIAKAAAIAPTTSATFTGPSVLNPQLSISSSTVRTGVMPTPTSILQHNNSTGTAGIRGPPPFNYNSTSIGFDPSSSSATPSRMAASAPNRSTGRLNLGPSAAETYYDNGYGNDGSTIASSVDHGIIDIGGNDDATVSTIGSFPAVYPPIPASYAPPGFSNGPILPAMENGGHQPQHRGITQAQWEAHRSLSMTDSYALNNNGAYNHSLGMGGLGITSMIPESSPLPNHHRNYYDDMQAPSLNLPSQSNTLPSAFGSFSGTSADFAPGNASLFGGGSTTLMRNDGGATQYGNETPGLGAPLGFSMSPYRSNPLERSISAPTSSSYLNDAGSHNIPGGLFGFGSDLNQKALDSTIIDSISTGNTGIGGSALWGSAPESHTSTGGGTSSLLENLILNSTSTPNDYQQENTLFASNEMESQFPETSFLSKDAVAWDRNRLQNNLHSTHEGTNGSSIW